MSKITIVNRKFLEEQVRLALKEQIQEPSYLSRMDPVESAAYEEQRALEIYKNILLDVVAVPHQLYRWGDKIFFSGGNKARQALFHSDAPAEVKYFFGVYETDPSSNINLNNFEPDNFVVSRDLTKKVAEVERLDDPKQAYEELVDFYSDGLFGLGDISDNVLVSESSADQIIKTAQKNELPIKTIIKLFFRGAFNSQYDHDPYLEDFEIENEGIVNFLNGDKPVYLKFLNEKFKKDFGAFVVYSSMDPTLTKDLESWKKAFSKITNTENAEIPFNVTRLLIEMGLWSKAEKLLSKKIFKTTEILEKGAKKLGKKLGRFTLLALATIAIEDLLIAADNNFITGRIDIKLINKAIEEAKQKAIKIAKQKNFSFSTEDITKIKKILMDPLDVAIEKLGEKYGGSLLEMSAEDLTVAFLISHGKLNKIKEDMFKVHKSDYINNKQDFKNFMGLMDDYKNQINDFYSKSQRGTVTGSIVKAVKGLEEQNTPSPSPSVTNVQSLLQNMSAAKRQQVAAAFKDLKLSNTLDPKYDKTTGLIEWAIDYVVYGNPGGPAVPALETLHASVAKPARAVGFASEKETRKNTKSIKIRGILIGENELNESGLDVEFISKLVKWYDLRKSTIRGGGDLSGNLRTIMQLSELIDKQKGPSGNLGKYSSEFLRKWRAFGEPLGPGIKSRTKIEPTFTRFEYGNFGLFGKLIGRGSLLESGSSLNMVFAPLVWFLEKNSCFVVSPAGEIQDKFEKIAEYSTFENKGNFIDVKINFNAALENTERESRNALQAITDKETDLAKILQINLETIKIVRKTKDGLFTAITAANNAIKRAEVSGNDQKPEQIRELRQQVKPAFMYFDLLNKMELFFSKNSIRFF